MLFRLFKDRYTLSGTSLIVILCVFIAVHLILKVARICLFVVPKDQASVGAPETDFHRYQEGICDISQKKKASGQSLGFIAKKL